MDRTEERLIEFADGLSFAQLPMATVDATRLRIIDSIGVALAASGVPPVMSLTKMAPVVAMAGSARIWGTGLVTTADHAALTNGTMVRYLDMNDAYTLTSTAHQSDNIAGMMALAESLDRSFADLVLAIVVCYEMQCRFCDVVPFHQNGWDQPVVGAPAAALGAAKLFGLRKAQMRDALSLAVTPNLPTYQTRRGELSMWKNMAGPNGARIGVHAAMMAAAGITGPQDCFDGPTGLWAQTLGPRMDVPLPTHIPGHRFAIEQSDIKRFPIRNACQLPTLLALEMRDRVSVDAIQSVTVWTDEHSFGVPAQDPALWTPTTRESADHSLPFCVAAALLDGRIGLETFEARRFLDGDIRGLISRVTIRFDPAFTQAAPEQRACRLVIEDTRGQSHQIERIWAAGDPARLPSRDAVFAKFRGLASPDMGEDRAERILHAIVQTSPSDPAARVVDLLVPKTP